MEITEITILKRDNRKLKAFVNVVFDNSFAVKGMKIIQCAKGLLLVMPTRKHNGAYLDVAYPINRAFRKKLEQKIFDEYTQVINGQA